MSSEIEFLLFRYTLPPPVSRPLFVQPLPTPRGAAVVTAIIDRRHANKPFPYWRRNNAWVGFREVGEDTGVYVGRVAKQIVLDKGDLVEGDVLSSSVESWLPLWCVFDTRRQLVAVEKSGDFGSTEHIQKTITAGLRKPILARYGHRVHVEPLTEVESFWKIIGEHEKLYRIELRLISPNLLEANRRASESLKALKQIFGQDEVNIKLENYKGNLKADDKVLQDYLEFAAVGEGRWKVVVRKIAERAKKTFSSLGFIRSIRAEIPDSGEDRDATERALRRQIEAVEIKVEVVDG